MSFCEHPDRNRQSCHATKILPAPSISAVGSGPVRRLPATVWLEIDALVDVLSHTVQFLSRSSPAPAAWTVTGFPQEVPPVVERFTITATPLGVELSASDETIQTLCRASNATDGSLTRAYGPAGLVKTVIPGITPLVHETPLFVEVAQPMSDAPPLKKRPNCAAATIVEPKE